MELRMIISDRRPELLATWQDVFDDIEEVDFLSIDTPTLMRLPEADAVLMMGMFAHERYGGTPIIGKSQILSTAVDPELAPWVITTPPLPAHFEKERQYDGTFETVVVQDQNMPTWEEDYIIFSEVFRCVAEFNDSREEPRIRTLAFDLEFLNFPRGEPRKEAEAVRRAYLEHCGPGHEL